MNYRQFPLSSYGLIPNRAHQTEKLMCSKHPSAAEKRNARYNYSFKYCASECVVFFLSV